MFNPLIKIGFEIGFKIALKCFKALSKNLVNLLWTLLKGFQELLGKYFCIPYKSLKQSVKQSFLLAEKQ